MSNLCCLLMPTVKCRECLEQWCEDCWFGPNMAGSITSHTTENKRNGGWGKCPKVGKYVGWDSNSTPELQWIHVRGNQDLYAEEDKALL